ncbi:MAG: Rrf2 family transcriptional regulator [Bacteroidota bacterium]|nr:Rrf2 family transcriptional regulator [Bacteroidota bacterium]
MAKVITLTEAASIGIHGLIIVARAESPITVKDIAEKTGCSKHHVAKIFQRLVKEGFVKSTRGPAGGFVMKETPENLSFKTIYESIEGPIEIGDCPHDKEFCPFGYCIFNNKIQDLSNEFIKYLDSQTIADHL